MGKILYNRTMVRERLQPPSTQLHGPLKHIALYGTKFDSTDDLTNTALANGEMHVVVKHRVPTHLAPLRDVELDDLQAYLGYGLAQYAEVLDAGCYLVGEWYVSVHLEGVGSVQNVVVTFSPVKGTNTYEKLGGKVDYYVLPH
jgi:hypothetical protein